MYTNLVSDIKELSDIDFQKKVWLNLNNNTNYISSYIELYNKLFDDDQIDDYYRELKSKNKNGELVLQLDKLINMLNAYKEPEDYNGNDICILEDPNWVLITEQAKVVYTLLEIN